MSLQRILVIKLSDLGDVLTATPALRSLRRTFPHVRVAVLTTPVGEALLAGTGLADDVRTVEKRRFDRRAALGHPARITSAAALGLWLRRQCFDAVLLLHHLTTGFGALKFRWLLAATKAPVRAGLDNGRGGFLTRRAPDHGFGARHEVEYCNDVAGLLGAPPDRGPLVFPVTDAARIAAQGLLAPAGNAPLAVIHPGGGVFAPARRWPAERFAAVAQRLGAEGFRVAVVGGAEETQLAGSVAAAAGPGALSLAGRAALRTLGAVLTRASVFVGNDAGVMHVAAAVGTPVVAVFGPSNHAAWGPWTGGQSPAVVLRAELPCAPCIYRGHALGTPAGCPARTCLTLVTPEHVTRAALDAARAPTRTLHA